MAVRLICFIGSFVVFVAITACTSPTPDAAALDRAVQATLTALASPSPTASASVSAVSPTLSSSAAPTLVSPLTSQPTPAPTPTAPSGESIAVVSVDTLNLRAGPGTGHPIIGSMRSGDRLQVSGRNAQGDWLEVTAPDGKHGWVSAALVQPNRSVSQLPTAHAIPTPPPAPLVTPASPPSNVRRQLEVTFVNLHYECQQTEWEGDPPVWGYRSFQVDIYIRNDASQPVEPPWKPKRWIITDGATERTSEIIWEWGGRRVGLYQQPVINPGQRAGWTFLAFPIERNEWVKAAEFVWNGQIYRQEFDLGPLGNADNYRDCGEYKPHSSGTPEQKSAPGPPPR